MLYFYGFCNGSAAAAVEYHQQFSMHKILDHRVFSVVFNMLFEHGMLSIVHVSFE
jgi:hypothetical protein